MQIELAAQPVLAYLLASVRIIAWLLVVPPFQGKIIPLQAKIVLAIGLALTVAPALTRSGVPTDQWQLGVVALTQVAVGLSLGFVTSLILGTIAAAGSMIDVFGGFALAQGFDPLQLTMNTVFGKFHSMLATMLLFATGGHLVIIGGLLRTFDVLPLGKSPSYDGAPTMIISVFTMFFMTALQIALPLIAVLFIADLGLALLTKVAPQFNALNVMFPAKIGLTLLIVGMSFPVLTEVTARLVELVNQAADSLVSGGG